MSNIRFGLPVDPGGQVKRIIAVTVVLVLAGSVVVAMAGVANAAPLTESQFKKKANAICRAGNREGDALDNKFFGNLGKNEAPDQATIDAFVVEFVPSIQDQIDAIGALKEPKSLSSGVNKLLNEGQRVLDSLEADHSLLFSDNNPFAKTSKLAKAVGLKQCA